MKLPLNFKTKSFFVDVLVVVIGVLGAIGLFTVIMRVNASRERDKLVPSALEAVNQKEYSKAISLFKTAEKEFPQNEEIKRQLGNLYFIKGKYDEALQYYSSVDQSKLTNYEIEDIGKIYYEKQDLDKVIEKWEGKEISPESKYKLARIYYDKERFDDFYRTLDAISKYKEPLLLLQIKEPNLQTAIDNIDKASKQEALNVESFNIDLLKSQIIDAKKQNDLGKKDYSELIQIAAFGNLSECRILFSRIEAVKKSLESKKISTYQADYYKGYCLNQINKPDDAIPLIEAAIKSDSSMVEYRESLAKSYFLKSDSEKVKQIYSDILNIQRTPVHYENLAIYMYRLGKLDESLKNYDQAITLEQKKESKQKYARSILQINLLDLKNLEICRRSELLELLDKEVTDQNLILGHCKLYVNKNLDSVSQNNELVYSYFVSLEKKNRDKINQVLDRDVDGLITTYYKAVGEKLMKS